MNIRQKIYDYAAPMVNRLRLQDVRIGLGYTAVLLDNGSCGVAYSYINGKKNGCTLFNGEIPLHGKAVKRVIPLILSNDEIEVAVGLATLNAVLNRADKKWSNGDILEGMTFKASDRVGMVGHFRPLVASITKQVEKLYIFEQIERKTGNLYPAQDIERIMPKCDIAIITSTAIINNTLDSILAHSRNCREVLLLGPSTPLAMDIFSETPVTMLSGVIVTHPTNILNIVSCGGGMMRFKNFVQKVNLMNGTDA